MASGGNSGGSLLVLLALLGLLGGLGAWNYQRNLAAEQAERRPYRTLADADLATLLAATEAEAEKLTGRYQRARSQRVGAGAGDRFGDFERAQRHGRQVRELGYASSELEAILAELRREQARRAGQGGELQIFLRRAFIPAP